MVRILIADDDYNSRRLMETILSQNGYETVSAENGTKALEELCTSHIDMIILDLMMPEVDGFEVARRIRKMNNNIPILMLTAKESTQDKREGFIAGTDDYMVKPADEEEMLLRIRALLRRARISNEHLLKIGGTELDSERLTVNRENSPVELPKKEFQLLHKLLSYEDRIFTRRSLMDELWELNSEAEIRTVDVHINRLRDRFRDNPDFSIETVRGLGYKAVINAEN